MTYEEAIKQDYSEFFDTDPGNPVYLQAASALSSIMGSEIEEGSPIHELLFWMNVRAHEQRKRREADQG